MLAILNKIGCCAKRPVIPQGMIEEAKRTTKTTGPTTNTGIPTTDIVADLTNPIRSTTQQIIGSGSFGIVLRVLPGTSDIPIARKVIRISQNPRFHAQELQNACSEIAFLTALKGRPFVLQLQAYKITPKYVLIDTPECLGGTLMSLYAECYRGMAIKYAWLITLQIASALKHIHDAGLVHHDIKPSNILLKNPPLRGTKPKIVVSDFGSAALASMSPQYPQGSMPYFAPEKAAITVRDIVGLPVQKETALTRQKSDIWSAGVVIYGLFTHGKLPWQSHNDLRHMYFLVQLIKDAKNLTLPDTLLPINVQTMLRGCLNTKIADRLSADALQLYCKTHRPDTADAF